MKSERSSKISETILQATQSLLSTLSTSYGPRGLDKMIVKDKQTVVTNDGATILKYFNSHPIHKILSSVSAAQDVNCGDGTTSVIILISSIMEHITPLKSRGIHPSIICSALDVCKSIAIDYIDQTKIRIDENDYVNVALTALNSKIASKSIKMANVAVDAIKHSKLEDIKVIKHTGGEINDIRLFKSILVRKNFKVDFTDARLLVLQFCISAPKPNLDSKIEITDYSQIEQFVREEKEYILDIVRKIRDTGANLVIIQKSLLKESCSEMAHHFLRKLNIHVVDNVDRAEIAYICDKLRIHPVSDVDLLTKPVSVAVSEVKEFLEIKNHGCSIVVSGCDDLVVDEAERSLHDVLCVVKSLSDEPYIVPGGCAIEAGIANCLDVYSDDHSLIVKSIAKAFAAMPHFLAQNAGLYSVDVVTHLRTSIPVNRNLGISMRNGLISDMVNDENVIQPVVVSKSMVLLAFETVQMLIKIDDILPTKQ